MFCPECGKQLDDNALFCGECGARLLDADIEEEALPLPPELALQDDILQPPARFQQPDNTPVYMTPVTQGNTTPPGYTASNAAQQQADPKKKRNRKVLLIAIAVLAAVLLVLGGLYLKQQSDYKKAHAKTDVAFTINAPGYVAGTDSKIPLHVTGTDFEGKEMSQDVYVGSDGSGLSLMRGTYTLTVIASPLLSNGTIYDTPSVSITIVIDENGLQTPASQLSITFVVTDALDITDAQIDAAYNAARAAGMSESNATNLKNGVIKTRKDAQDKKAADDAAAAAAQKKAEEEAAAEKAAAAATKSELHYSCEYFELDVPERWRGKWSCSKTSTNGGYYYTFIESGTKLYDIMVLKVGTSGNHGEIYATTSDGKYNMYEAVSSGSWAAHEPGASEMEYLESTFRAK